MKKTLSLAIFIVAHALQAQTGAIQNFCVQGATPAAVSGLNSTNDLQGIVPSCTVTVYFTGTSTEVPGSQIYANPSNTVLGNPFTASTNGQWLFYAALGQGYDVALSTGFTFTDLFASCCGTSGAVPNPGWEDQLAANQTISATTLALTGSAGIPASGKFFVDGEYESYTSVNYSTNTLSGITRGLPGTTASAHSSGSLAVSIDFDLTPIPGCGVFGPYYYFACSNGFPVSGEPFTINSGIDEFDILTDGTIKQQNNSATDYLDDIMVGVPQGHNDGTNYVLPITNTSLLIQDNAPHEIFSPIGDSGGFAGLVTSIPAPNIGAPALYPQFIGSGTCNITYVVTGVDVDGVEVPGTAATVTGLAPWSSPASVQIRYPSAAGVVSYNGYRTAASGGCTGLALGKFATGVTGNYGVIADLYVGGDSTSPPGSNLSVAKACVGTAANHELYCHLAGSTSTPPKACGASTSGWDYTNVAATTAPSAYHCYSGGSTWTALSF